ncbi:hypothetical protein [Polyangium spumosum]|uniref:Uncharacterized protein n=1 Tax=Polyangium spumosum TaxID=889282 RepID=A0A6N7PWI8_9BACT|nr:hypothetical protein [Polyangium spumosum]MRG94454.1 hypothetical protein [Polyangium spumosum]
MTSDDREELLLSLRSGTRSAETAGRAGRSFYPVAEHLRVLEPEVVLVVGDPGAGKTLLFNVLSSDTLRGAAMRRASGVRVVRGEAEWLRGYPMARWPRPPDGHILLHQDHAHEETAATKFWLSSLVDALQPHFAGDPASALVVLESLDRRLAQEDRWAFVTYDALETLAGGTVRGLLRLWAEHGRRWSRIRPKMFLRTDIYKYHVRDIVDEMIKSYGDHVELSWSDKNLYGAMLKHLANLSNAWFLYCKRSSGDRVRFDFDPVLEHIPILARREDARSFVERLVGRYMGAAKVKGEAFSWLLDHLRDGNGKVFPRSLFLLLENAAALELENGHASGSQVLSPIALRNALDDGSQAHVQEIATEIRWLPKLKVCLHSDPRVPWESRHVLVAALAAGWDVWSGEDQDSRPPASSPEQLVDMLLDLGIVRDRGNGKYDVPDLYLHGLGLKRKGGVSKGTRQSAR